MDKIVLEAVKKYFTTLEYVGTINSKEQYRLLILLFLKDYVNTLEAVDNRVYNVFECLYRNSCIINKKLGCIEIQLPNSEGFTYTFTFNLA